MTLIDDWFSQWWKLASTRLAMVAGAVTGYFAANPDQWADLMDLIPDPWRVVAVPLIGITVTIVSGGSRVIAFKRKSA